MKNIFRKRRYIKFHLAREKLKMSETKEISSEDRFKKIIEAKTHIEKMKCVSNISVDFCFYFINNIDQEYYEDKTNHIVVYVIIIEAMTEKFNQYREEYFKLICEKKNILNIEYYQPAINCIKKKVQICQQKTKKQAELQQQKQTNVWEAWTDAARHDAQIGGYFPLPNNR